MENKENKEKKKEEQLPNFTVKHIEDEGEGTDFVSIAKSVEQGYEALSGTFSVNQANIAQKLNLGENIKQLVVIVQGNVYGNVMQAVDSQVNFSQQVTDAFKKAYNMVEKKEDIPPEQKEEIIKNLKVVEEELQSKEPDAGKIQRSWKWLKQNAKWLAEMLTQVVMEGVRIAYGT